MEWKMGFLLASPLWLLPERPTHGEATGRKSFSSIHSTLSPPLPRRWAGYTLSKPLEKKGKEKKELIVFGMAVKTNSSARRSHSSHRPAACPPPPSVGHLGNVNDMERRLAGGTTWRWARPLGTVRESFLSHCLSSSNPATLFSGVLILWFLFS